MQGVVAGGVVVQRQTVLYAVGHKAGVFAAAVVVGFGECSIRRWSLVKKSELQWHMTTAAQAGVCLATLGQHAIGGLHMLVLSVVAGTQQRHLRCGKAEMCGTATLNERQRLQGFERGTGESNPMRIARMGQQRATRIDYSNCSKVKVFS